MPFRLQWMMLSCVFTSSIVCEVIISWMGTFLSKELISATISNFLRMLAKPASKEAVRWNLFFFLRIAMQNFTYSLWIWVYRSLSELR
jgi:hypothetical protein